MAFRQIHTKIWKDPWFLDLPPDHKLLFIYLFSNEQANMMGLYQIALKVICFETDLDKATVEQALAQFARDGKVEYQDGFVWIVNMFRYNANNPSSPKTQAHIQKTLDELPDIPLKARLIRLYSEFIGVCKGYDTPPSEQEQNRTEAGTETEQEQKQEQGADAPVEPAAPHFGAAARDPIAVAARLAEIGIGEPKRTQLAAMPHVTLDYVDSWERYTATWKNKTVALPSMIKRMETRRQVPAEFRQGSGSPGGRG